MSADKPQQPETWSPPPRQAGSPKVAPFTVPPLAIAVVFYGVFNFLCMPLAAAMAQDGPHDGVIFLFAIGVGVLLSQFGVLPAWLVWGPRPFWQRILIHWALAANLSLIWLLGFAAAVAAGAFRGLGLNMLRDLAPPLLCLPAVSLAVETPLWFTRFFLGWRMRRTGAPAEGRRPLAIADFLWGMAVISVALALVRAADAISYYPSQGEIWIGMAISVGFASFASALVILPIAWCMLRIQEVERSIVVVAAYTMGLGIVITVVVVSLAGGAPDGQMFVAFFLFLGGLSASVAGALGLARGAGYRLDTGREKS